MNQLTNNESAYIMAYAMNNPHVKRLIGYT